MKILDLPSDLSSRWYNCYVVYNGTIQRIDGIEEEHLILSGETDPIHYLDVDVPVIPWGYRNISKDSVIQLRRSGERTTLRGASTRNVVGLFSRYLDKQFNPKWRTLRGATMESVRALSPYLLLRHSAIYDLHDVIVATINESGSVFIRRNINPKYASVIKEMLLQINGISEDIIYG